MGWLLSPPKLHSMQHQKRNAERRLKWLVVTCALFAALAGVTASHAQLYKWVDENGKVQYTDTIPPGNTDRARKELRSDGTVKLSTERAATAEEKRLAAIKAVEDAKLKVVSDERDRKDKALLNTYSSLADFDRVRDRALGTVAADIRTLEEREVVINKIIASNGAFTAPVVAPPPAAPPVAGKPAVPVKPPVVKTANTLLLEAKSELPRAKEAIDGKKRDLEALTAVYAGDRVRLSRLIDAENAKMNADKVSGTEPKAAPAVAVSAGKKKQ
jgi:Domain of unknown function (DUF4124)